MSAATPVKTRFVDGSGRIVFRHDLDNGYGLDANGMNAARNAVLAALREVRFDAVLISDYDKGFLNESLIWETIDLCVARQIPVVADAKRRFDVYRGATLKVNEDYRRKHGVESASPFQGVVVTRGCQHPWYRLAAALAAPLARRRLRQPHRRRRLLCGPPNAGPRARYAA